VVGSSAVVDEPAEVREQNEQLHEEELPADAIVWATGYVPDGGVAELFDAGSRALLLDECGGLRLYHRIVPVAEELGGLAFVGRVLSTSDVTVSFVQSEWLAALVSKDLSLPPAAERAAEAERHRAASRRFSADGAAPAAGHADVSLPLIHTYLDRLVSEVCTARGGRRLAAWLPWHLRFRWVRYLLPLRAADYAALLLGDKEDRIRKRM
jgi:hypothetical protein